MVDRAKVVGRIRQRRRSSLPSKYATVSIPPAGASVDPLLKLRCHFNCAAARLPGISIEQRASKLTSDVCPGRGCFGPTSMRKPLTRRERDDRGISQTSIRRHPRGRRTMKSIWPLPFTIAASHCATSDLGMRPESRSRSRPGQPPPGCAGVPRTEVSVQARQSTEIVLSV
jgi:hypothetical protein